MSFAPSAFQPVQPPAVPWLLSAAPTTACDSRSDYLSTVNGANNKRSLDYCLDAPSYHQQSNPELIRGPSERSSLAVEIEDDCDMSQHVFKRTRYSGNGDAIDINDPLSRVVRSEGVVPCISEHTVHGNSCRGPPYSSQPDSLWWKQRKPPLRCPSTNDGFTCFVCRRPNQVDTIDPWSRTSTAPTTHTKTLLSFFTPIDVPKKANPQDNGTRVRPSFSAIDSTTHERQSGSAAVVSPPTNGNSCTHCERSDICSNCIRPCEDCQLDFCAFCTTIDSAGSCLCLDCAASQSMRSFNDDDEADMQLD
jgi:hypothetical protein